MNGPEASSTSAQPKSPASLEDRIAVAVSKRGQKRIGQFIEDALLDEWMWLTDLSDEEFVLALEEAASDSAKGDK